MVANSHEKQLVLYTGTDCHLCELAKGILDEVIGSECYKSINISDNKILRAEYGIRIPVVKTEAGLEKDWPFTAGQIKRMLVG